MISRVLPLYRPLMQQLVKNGAHQQLIVRSSHAANYRCAAPPHSKATKYGAEIVSTLMWWWILWHMYYEHSHITGEFPYPDPKKWTNAELGIPK